MRGQRFSLVLVVVAIVVGGLQWSFLQGLERERKDLLHQKEAKDVVMESDDLSEREVVERQAGVSEEEVARFQEDVVQFVLEVVDGGLGKAGYRKGWMSFYRQAKSFSAANIAELIALLESDSRIPRELWQEAIVSDMLIEAAPFRMIDFLKENPEWKENTYYLPQAFYRCLQQDLSEGVKLFEREAAAGNVDFQTSNIRSSVLLALAQDYPDKMLAMAQSDDFREDKEATAQIGGFVDDRLETAEDFSSFLEAVQRAEKKGRNTEFLEKIRQDFIRETQGKFRDWSFEDTKQFVSGSLNREEQLAFFQNLKNEGDLREPEKWADWFSQVEPEEWSEWSGSDEHPLVSLLENTARRNQDFGESYLKSMPPGKLRDEAMLAFAWRLADSRPEKAAVYLEQLPRSKSKNRLKKRIEEHDH